MANTLYDELAATALELINEFGVQIVLKRYSSASVPGGVVTRTVSIQGSASAIVLPASKGTVEAFDNRLEEFSDKLLRYLKVAAKGCPFEPRSLDEIELFGSNWKVLGCTPVNPAGTPLVYGIGVYQL